MDARDASIFKRRPLPLPPDDDLQYSQAAARLVERRRPHKQEQYRAPPTLRQQQSIGLFR